MRSMRDYMKLVEMSDPDYEDDEDEVPENLASINEFKAIVPSLVPVVQKVYDDWQQDEDGYDEEVGNGGICHVIVDKMIDAAGEFDLYSVSSTHEQHVYIIGKFKEGIFEIDVPHRRYETGGGFTWTKLPGVVFDADDIVISCLDRDPKRISQYVDNDEW